MQRCWAPHSKLNNASGVLLYGLKNKYSMLPPPEAKYFRWDDRPEVLTLREEQQRHCLVPRERQVLTIQALTYKGLGRVWRMELGVVWQVEVHAETQSFLSFWRIVIASCPAVHLGPPEASRRHLLPHVAFQNQDMLIHFRPGLLMMTFYPPRKDSREFCPLPCICVCFFPALLTIRQMWNIFSPKASTL